MAESRGSVVRQLHRLLLGGRLVADMEASLASQLSDVENRVAKLHRLGLQYTRIRVSRHVKNLPETPAAEGCEGRRVATEV